MDKATQPPTEDEWVIRVLVPAHVAEDVRDRIFDAVGDAADKALPEDRDWDVFVSAHPERLP